VDDGVGPATLDEEAHDVRHQTAVLGSQEAQGLSERLIVSHWENNYGGAVKRLNAITAQLASLDFAAALVFVINGLKREELIATNSMIRHELYFDGLGDGGGQTRRCARR
jgi:hypothetical protein